MAARAGTSAHRGSVPTRRRFGKRARRRESRGHQPTLGDPPRLEERDARGRDAGARHGRIGLLTDQPGAAEPQGFDTPHSPCCKPDPQRLREVVSDVTSENDLDAAAEQTAAYVAERPSGDPKVEGCDFGDCRRGRPAPEDGQNTDIREVVGASNYGPEVGQGRDFLSAPSMIRTCDLLVRSP